MAASSDFFFRRFDDVDFPLEYSTALLDGFTISIPVLIWPIFGSYC